MITLIYLAEKRNKLKILITIERQILWPNDSFVVRNDITGMLRSSVIDTYCFFYQLCTPLNTINQLLLK